MQPKEVDLNDLEEWLETEVQVQEMAFGCASTKENPEQEKPKSNSNKSKWFKKKDTRRNDTHANSGAKVECFVRKEENVLKKLTVNERWELAKKFLLSLPQKGTSKSTLLAKRDMFSGRVCTKTSPTTSCNHRAATVKPVG